jgi:hypothetical protein
VESAAVLYAVKKKKTILNIFMVFRQIMNNLNVFFSYRALTENCDTWRRSLFWEIQKLRGASETVDSRT